MESFVFNNFKKRLMEGDVSNADTWKLYPVKNSFTENLNDTIQYIKSDHDFTLFSNGSVIADHLSTVLPINYTYKTMYELDIAQEPLYIDERNWGSFIAKYPDNEHLYSLFLDRNSASEWKRLTTVKGNDGNYLLRGFYYVKTAEELLWCAERVNGTVYDNKINIVLGDNIGRAIDINNIENKDDIDGDYIKDSKLLTGSNKGEFKHINFSIGANPAQPYEGIFYGNGFKILNIRYEVTTDVAGIIGYLGPKGIISTIEIAGQNILQCSKKINIEHLINSGTDVVAGLLCGKNNGTIEYVKVKGKIYVTNFVPTIYSISNKSSDDETVSEGNGKAYPFYPDYYCYNSQGNIIPYIGYFNEGVAATYSGYNETTDKFYTYWMTNNSEYKYSVNDGMVSPMEWYYWYGYADASAHFALPCTDQKYRTNVLWYDGNVNSLVNKLDGYVANQVNDNGLYLFKPNSIDAINGTTFESMKYAQYFNKSIKLSQQNRAAYYVSPIVGINNSNISAVREQCELYTSGTFVGFIGGIAGKQAVGNITNAVINLSSFDIKDDNENTTSDHYYLRNYLKTNNEVVNATANYKFIKKSIKNISSLFGSCVVGNKESLTVDTVSSYLYNYNNIVYDNSTTKVLYDDYYFMNRFGAFAAMVEYNSSNISDIWFSQALANDLTKRSIYVKNSKFGYNEGIDANIDGEESISLYTPYKIFYKHELAGYEDYMYGIASPLFPEIKPIYLQIPSIISTPFYNTGNILKTETNKLETTATYEGCDLTLQGELVADSMTRVGAYTIDQNLAAPYSDPNFWCINTELDLPGVANRPTYRPNGAGAYAGGIVDRLNNSACLNFDLNIQNIARNLIYWNNTDIIGTFNFNDNVFSSVTVPAAAMIMPAVWENDGVTGYCNADAPNGAEVVANNYNANKVLNLYPYFGSDIEIIPNTADAADLKTDLASKYYRFVAEFKNPLFWALPSDAYTYENKHKAGNCVDRVRMEFSESALNYAPFTDVTATESTVNLNIMFSAHISKENGNNAHTDPDQEWKRMIYYSKPLGHNGDNPRDDWPEIFGKNGAFGVGVDYDNNDGDTRSMHFVIPFEQVVYNIRNAVTGHKHPPYNTFFSTYIIGHNHHGDHDPSFGSDSYDGLAYTRDYDIFQLTPKLQYWPYVQEQLLRPLEFVSGYYVKNFRLLSGINTNNEKVYYRDNVTPSHSDREVTDLTAYKTGYDDDAGIYRFLDSDDNFTDNIEDAVSGYVWNKNETIDKSKYVLYTTTDGRTYRYYYYNPDRIKENRPSQDSNRVYMSAVKWYGVNSADWNWQSYVIDELEDYDYKFKTENALYEPAEELEIVPAPAWPELNCTGYFRNNLLPSNAAIDSNKPGTDGNTGTFDINNEMEEILCDDAYANLLAANYSASLAVSLTDNDILDYYRYTYDKKYEKSIKGWHIDLPVKFDYQNHKRGFWFTSKDLIKDDNNKSVSAVSGDIEYNDDLRYYGNVLFIGKTLSQESILNKCLKLKTEYSVSGFSADEFAGIYVTDSVDRPVMYIDTSLGECSDGTSWSLSSYPSLLDFSAFSATDWINDENRKYTEAQKAAYNNATIDEKVESANNVWHEDWNTCSGLLLEIE